MVSIRMAKWLMVAGLLTAAGCGGQGGGGGAPATNAASGEDAKPVVVINGETVTRAQYEDALYDRFAENHLETFIEDHLLEAKAKELGVSADEAKVTEEVKKNVDSLLRTRFNGSEEAMRRALRDRGMTLEGWKDDLERRARRDSLTEAIIKKQRGEGSDIVQRRFEQKYGEDGVKYRVRHILVSTKVINSNFYTKEDYEKEQAQIEAQLKKEGEELIAKIKGGADFEEMAKAHSDDFTKSRGGDLGQSWKGRFGQAFDEVVEKLQPGQLSPLVKGRRGFHIVEVTGVQKGVKYKGKAMLVSNGPNGPGDRRSQEVRDEDAKKKLDAVLAELKKGTDFAEVARKQSDDTATKSRGGDLGTFGRRRLGKEVDVVLETAAVGKVTEPIKSARGYWLVLLEERSMVPSDDRKTVRHILLSSDYDDVKRRKLEGRLEELAKKRADELLTQIQGGADFAEIASKESEDAYTRKTGGEYMNYRSTSLGPEVWAAVKKMEANAEPQIVKSNRGYHIVQVMEKKETTFDSVKTELLTEMNEQPVSPSEVRDLLSGLKEAAKIDRKIGAAPPADEKEEADAGAAKEATPPPTTAAPADSPGK